MPQRLSEVELDEVSLVDEPANQLAKVVLVKRKGAEPDLEEEEEMTEVEEEEEEEEEPEEEEPEEEEMEKVAPAGVKFVIGFPEDGSGSEVQSVVFDSEKWDAARAKKWLKDHNMVSGKTDETTNTLRFRQKEPEGFKRFRMIEPGAGIAKALKVKDSFQRVQSAVDTALRQEFEKPGVPNNASLPLPSFIYIRDLYKDSVVFEQDGQIWRAEYGVTYDDDGNIHVNIGNKVPVEVVYQDVKKVDEPEPDMVPDLEPFALRASKIHAEVLLNRFK